MKTFIKVLLILPFVFLIFVFTFDKGKPKIYDCFPFFNEVELLKIRMTTLYDHVDHFVIVESVETHQGDAKPLYFEENKELFAPFADKIIHITLQERLKTDNPWVRENYQRNQIVRGLIHCKDSDIILISDLDEIVDPKCLRNIRYHLMRGKRAFVGTTQRMYIYYLNHFDSLWHGTVATTYKALKERSPQYFRDHRNKGLRLPHSGWHFTYIGGLEKVIQKLEAFAHSEGNTPENKNKEILLKKINAGPHEQIDSSFPQCIRDQESYYRSIGFIK